MVLWGGIVTDAVLSILHGAAMHARSIALDTPKDAAGMDDFDLTVRKYHRKIYTLIYRMVGNPEESEDLTQETFLLAFRYRSTFRKKADVYTWLYRIAVNECRKKLKKTQRRRRIWTEMILPLFRSDMEENASLPPIDSAGDHDRNDENSIGGLVRRLPPPFRETILLRYYDEMSYDEIAKILRCSKGTVRSRLSRGRKMLLKLAEENKDEM
jgi:RNA polymerase sigma-70 factor (ECF subfamily)